MKAKKEIIKTLEEYLQGGMWKCTEPPLGKTECELFLKLLKAERPKGKPIIKKADYLLNGFEVYLYECPECNKTWKERFNFCPNCGLDWRE